MENDPSSGTGGMEAWKAGGSSLAPRPATGFKTASLALMGVGAVAFALGLFPCLGWLNWVGVPVNGLAALVGLLGLNMGPKKPDGTRAYQGYYIAAVGVGAIGLIGGTLRCLSGGGIF